MLSAYRQVFPPPPFSRGCPGSEVDCSFFLVTVDLWSADGKHEMNLVLHPTSADRYVPANTPKNKRRGTVTTNTSNQRSTRQSPAPSLPPPSTPQYSQQVCPCHPRVYVSR